MSESLIIPFATLFACGTRLFAAGHAGADRIDGRSG